jgi:hypothetical protein
MGISPNAVPPSKGEQERRAKQAEEAAKQGSGGMARHVTTLIWPTMIGGFIYMATSSRARTAFTPLVFAGLGAYAVRKAMDNDRDYVSFGVPSLGNLLGWDFLAKDDQVPF